VIPVAIESALLIAIAVFYPHFIPAYPDIIAFSLLFAMGLQNSLVTSISNATVRTTHLTGLFTDLGIELSQMFFYKSAEQRHKLFSSVKLRLTIISFFFLGGIVGGLLYSAFHLHSLFVAGILLVVGLVYDNLKFKLILVKRKLRV
jgi:uncharacterized membrane protein YoaK (UPF0700 family)